MKFIITVESFVITQRSLQDIDAKKLFLEPHPQNKQEKKIIKEISEEELRIF